MSGTGDQPPASSGTGGTPMASGQDPTVVPPPAAPPAPAVGSPMPSGTEGLPAPPPAAPDAPPAPAAGDEPPETLTLTSAQLKERLDRAQAADRARWLKDQGFESEEAFAAWKTQADEAASAAEEKKREEMSEIERLKADLEASNAAKAEAETKAQQAAEAAQAARTEAHLRQLFAARGITNVDYAFFRVEQACDALPEGQLLDEEKFLDELVGKEDQKSALGIGSAQAGTPPVQAAQTTQTQTGPPPAPQQGGSFDAMNATPEQIAARKRELGIG